MRCHIRRKCTNHESGECIYVVVLHNNFIIFFIKKIKIIKKRKKKKRSSGKRERVSLFWFGLGCK